MIEPVPPLTVEAPPTIDRGQWASLFLTHNGLPADNPHIRSSDFSLISDCPYLYFLQRRLGLTHVLRHSEALSRGTWFHHCMENYDLPIPQQEAILDRKIEARLREVETICAAYGITGALLDSYMADESADFHTARAWYLNVPATVIPSHFKILAREAIITLPGSLTCPPLTAQPDLLLYHTAQNSLWALDWKSCTEQPSARLATVPGENQTVHYLYILKQAIQSAPFRERFGLPPDVTLGGMAHVAVQKCGLKMCDKDRPFTLDTSPLKSGPRKGQPRNVKVYDEHAVPDFHRYLERTRDWYTRSGEYAHDIHEREHPIGISWVPYDTVTDFFREHAQKIAAVAQYALCPPEPERFPRMFDSLRKWGKLSPYTPFYFSPISEYPSLMLEKHFIRSPRDVQGQAASA